MDTTEFDRLTEHFARMNEASAFVAGRIANGILGGLVHHPRMLSDFLTLRKSIIHQSLHALATKAAVAAIDLSSGLAPASPDARAFLAQVERVSPLGQIGGITVDGNVTGTIQTGNATASWAGEQTSKPVTALAFSSSGLLPLKVIAQIVVSEELASLTAQNALSIVQRSLVSAAAAAEATALLDPRMPAARM